MTQQPVEMILLRQWAQHLASPVWVMDAEGSLVYYNEPAEEILGLQFDGAGAIHADELAERFVTTAPDGSPVDTADLPVVVALTEGRPSHATLRIMDHAGDWHDIEATALPLITSDGRRLGALTVFWEIDG